jgi:hypothetical protein
MKQLFTLTLLLISLNTYSQYYLEAELHFIDGSIRNGLAHINTLNDRIKFKSDEESKRISFNHEEINTLILKKDSISKTYKYKKAIGKRTPRLLELISENENLSLYAIVDEQAYNNFTMYGMYGAIGGIVSGIASSIVDDKTRVNYTYYFVKNNEKKAHYLGMSGSSKKRLRQKIKKYFNDCPTLIKKSESEEYKVSDIPKIIEFYNEHCGN